jgi:hypothetical protein
MLVNIISFLEQNAILLYDLFIRVKLTSETKAIKPGFLLNPLELVFSFLFDDGLWSCGLLLGTS